MSAFVPIWLLPSDNYTLRVEGLKNDDTRLFYLVATVEFGDLSWSTGGNINMQGIESQ
jgi:hypothetical protein